MPVIDLDLDAIHPPAVRFKLHGEIKRIFPVFSGLDHDHFLELRGRVERNKVRADKWLAAYTAHQEALSKADAAGRPAPKPRRELDQFGEKHPDYLSDDVFKTHVFRLLASVWAYGEYAKPEAERDPVTEEWVTEQMDERRAWVVLGMLWAGTSRVEMPDEPEPEPAAAPPKRGRKRAAV